MEKVLGRFILIISKKNEVYLNIKTEPNYARELSDFFTFEVPGARFMPSYRNKYWDGKIRLFNQMNGEIYVAPALAAISAWLGEKQSVTFVFTPFFESSLHALIPSTVRGNLITTFL